MRSPTSTTVSKSNLYSVFVGHLALDVTKADLKDLFEDCGAIGEIYVMKQAAEMCFTFGFVRFRHLEDAKQSIKDLNGWMLKGNRISVEIARDTVLLTKSGPEELSPKVQQAPVEKIAPRRSHGETKTDNMVGLKNLKRLRDTCSVSETPIDVNELLNDVSEENYSRPPAQVSKLYDVDCSIEKCVEQLKKCRCSMSCASNKKANQFLKSMRHIINDIGEYLDKTGTTDPETSDDTDPWNESNSDWNRKSNTSNDTSSPAVNTEELVNGDFKDETRKPHKVIRSPLSEDDSGHCTEDPALRNCSSSDDSFSYKNKSTESAIKRVLGRGRELSSAKQAFKQQHTSRFIGRGCALAISSEKKIEQNHW